MGKAIFDKADGHFRQWVRHSTPIYNATTQIMVDAPEPIQDAKTKRWDGATGIRDATAQEIADQDAAKLDAEANVTIDGDKKERFLFEINFNQENRLRVLESKSVLTKAQYRDALKKIYQEL